MLPLATSWLMKWPLSSMVLVSFRVALITDCTSCSSGLLRFVLGSVTMKLQIFTGVDEG
jgi:hypothetical protein